MALIDAIYNRSPRLTAKRRFFSLGQLFSLWRSRRALTRLDKHQLDDIGVNPTKASREARRPLWDVPDNWLR